MAVILTGSVGMGGKNNASDILAIQNLLNKWVTPQIAATGVCNGTATDQTVIAIKKFQSNFSANPDGRVDAGGGTLKRLNSVPFVQLTQMSGFGYYSYAKFNDFAKRQWGTPNTIQALKDVALQFKLNNPMAQVGLGDISFQFGGHMDPHSTHKEGMHVDVRPQRTDNVMDRVAITEPKYDSANTKLLIELFLSHKNVKNILFNDPLIYALPRVSYYDKHHDHFHITMLS
jgi:hypothetical protein